MAAPVKAVLVAVIAAAALFILTQLAFFFPFYMTIVIETINLANVAADDNYVRYEYWESSLQRLQERAVFSKAYSWDSSSISIEVVKGTPGDAHGSAIGDAREDGTDFYYDRTGWADRNKPYRQRGEPLTITVRAAYPFEVSMWGWSVSKLWPASFRMTTIGVKYYKDLPYDYLFG